MIVQFCLPPPEIGIAPYQPFGYKGTVKIWSAMMVLLAGTWISLAQPQASAPAQRPLTLAEVERLYLDGRITAKDFQQYLKQLQSQPPAVRAAVVATNQPTPPPRWAASEDGQARALEMLRKLTGKTNEPLPEARPTGPPSTNAAVVAPLPEPVSPELTDVEKRMNELLRLKEAREKSSQTGTNSPPSTTGPKSKRQRLDDLLKQFIDGKMTEAEYKQRREKIIGEPE